VGGEVTSSFSAFCTNFLAPKRRRFIKVDSLAGSGEVGISLGTPGVVGGIELSSPLVGGAPEK